MTNQMVVKAEKSQDWMNMSDLAQLLAEIDFEAAAQGAAQTLEHLLDDGVDLTPNIWSILWTTWAKAQPNPVFEIFEAPEMPQAETEPEDWAEEWEGWGDPNPNIFDQSYSASEWAMTRNAGQSRW